MFKHQALFDSYIILKLVEDNLCLVLHFLKLFSDMHFLSTDAHMTNPFCLHALDEISRQWIQILLPLFIFLSCCQLFKMIYVIFKLTFKFFLKENLCSILDILGLLLLIGPHSFDENIFSYCSRPHYIGDKKYTIQLIIANI